MRIRHERTSVIESAATCDKFTTMRDASRGQVVLHLDSVVSLDGHWRPWERLQDGKIVICWTHHHIKAKLQVDVLRSST